MISSNIRYLNYTYNNALFIVKKLFSVFCFFLFIVFFLCALLINSGDVPTEENTVEVAATVKSVSLTKDKIPGAIIYINEDSYGIIINGYKKGSETEKELLMLKEGTNIYFRIDECGPSPRLFSPAYSLKTDELEVMSLSQYKSNKRRVIIILKTFACGVAILFLMVAIGINVNWYRRKINTIA